MREQEVAVPSLLGLAATVCLPDDAAARRRAPAILLLGGSGANTRDGDLEPGWPPGTPDLPKPGTVRRVAHRLAHAGVATLRWDRRGFGASGGRTDETDYDTDLEDALAALSWLRDRADIDAGRVGVAGHSAGALTACHVCRDAPEAPTAAIFLGALASPIDDMLRWNVGRMIRHWGEFGPDRQAWMLENLPTHLLRAEGGERYLEAAARGEPSVVLEGHGVTLELRTRRTFQDLHTSYEAEFRHVGCPALVLHGGEDLNVPVADALTAYQALRRAGNDDVTLTVLPGLDHYFHPVPPEPLERIWERVSLESLDRQMAPEALDAIAGWAERVLHP